MARLKQLLQDVTWLLVGGFMILLLALATLAIPMAIICLIEACTLNDIHMAGPAWTLIIEFIILFFYYLGTRR